jgi:hypothetical protein
LVRKDWAIHLRRIEAVTKPTYVSDEGGVEMLAHEDCVGVFGGFEPTSLGLGQSVH